MKSENNFLWTPIQKKTGGGGGYNYKINLILGNNDKICGKGNGNSKKAAKNNAAEEALKVLIPEYKGQNSDSKKNTDDMYAVSVIKLFLTFLTFFFEKFFDAYNVEHSHIYSLAQSMGAPLPYEVLLTCLK